MAKNWKSYAKKQVRRAWRAGTKFVKKRYLHKGGMANVIRDVALIKKVINSEKKLYRASAGPAVVGQVSGNSNAGLYLDLTPIPSQGTTRSTRNGASVKLCSQYFRFQITQQSATVSPIRLRFQLFQNVGSQNNINVGVASGELHQSNPFNGLIDYNSNRNPDYLRDWKLLREKKITLPTDPLASTLMIKELAFGMKYKSYHIRFNGDTNTPLQGQMIMVITADNGNCSTTTASTTANIPITIINSGATVAYSVDSYFYDN